MKTVYALILVVVAVVAVLYLTGNIPEEGTWNIGGGSQSISNLFHSMIDSYRPDAIDQAETACESISGTWFDQADKFGCYSIPVGSFDPSMCSTELARLFQNLCEGVDGAEWVCSTTHVGCNY